MIRRKSKVFLSFISLCLSIAILGFGVYSAMQVSYTLSGSVNYVLSDVFVDIQTTLYLSTSDTLTSDVTLKNKIGEFETSLPTSGASETEKHTTYLDEYSSYIQGVGFNRNHSSKNIPINYGAYEKDKTAYAYYIVVAITNTAENIINARLDLGDTSALNSIVDRNQTSTNINGKETVYFIIGMALNDATISVNQTFNYTITIATGELKEPTLYAQSEMMSVDDASGFMVSSLGLSPVDDVSGFMFSNGTGQSVDLTGAELSNSVTSTEVDGAQVAMQTYTFDQPDTIQDAVQVSINISSDDVFVYAFVLSGKDYVESDAIELVNSIYGNGTTPEYVLGYFFDLTGQGVQSTDATIEYQKLAEISDDSQITVMLAAMNNITNITLSNLVLYSNQGLNPVEDVSGFMFSDGAGQQADLTSADLSTSLTSVDVDGTQVAMQAYTFEQPDTIQDAVQVSINISSDDVFVYAFVLSGKDYIETDAITIATDIIVNSTIPESVLDYYFDMTMQGVQDTDITIDYSKLSEISGITIMLVAQNGLSNITLSDLTVYAKGENQGVDLTTQSLTQPVTSQVVEESAHVAMAQYTLDISNASVQDIEKLKFNVSSSSFVYALVLDGLNYKESDFLTIFNQIIENDGIAPSNILNYYLAVSETGANNFIVSIDSEELSQTMNLTIMLAGLSPFTSITVSDLQVFALSDEENMVKVTEIPVGEETPVTGGNGTFVDYSGYQIGLFNYKIENFYGDYPYIHMSSAIGNTSVGVLGVFVGNYSEDDILQALISGDETGVISWPNGDIFSEYYSFYYTPYNSLQNYITDGSLEFCISVLSVAGIDLNTMPLFSIGFYETAWQAELNSDGKSYTITGYYDPTVSDIEIPSIYNGLPVTAVNGFSWHNSLSSVVIPEGVKGVSGFDYCWGLQSITLPTTIEDINVNSSSSSSLSEININITSVDDWAEEGGRYDTQGWRNFQDPYYSYNYGEINLYLNGTLINETIINTDKIRDYAFACCSIKSITIPSSVTSIEDAFYGCSSLETVKFEDNSQIQSITSDNFVNCSSLKTVTFGDNSQLTNIELSNFGSLERVTFGDNSKLTSIYFEGCSSLKSIEIPIGVTSIEGDAFNKCTSLKEVYISDINAWLMIDFSNSSSNPLSNGADLYLNDKLVTEVTLPEITTIGDYAFYNCTSLTSITIPESMTSIGYDAFYGCYALAEVYNYSPSITASQNFNYGYLGYYAKIIYNSSDLSDLEDIKPETKIQTIGNMQYYVNGEDFIALAPSVGRSNLTQTQLDPRTTEINISAFEYCASLTRITIPSGVTSIGANAFSGCTSLTSITIPDSVTSIGTNAFSGCSSLTSVTMPESVTSIGSNAFENCYALEEVYITDIYAWLMIDFSNYRSNPLSSGADLYLNNKLVTKVILPEIITIRDYAFSGCTSLTSVTIPDSVTSIGTNAFSSCYALKEVHITDIDAWAMIYFDDYSSNPLSNGAELYLNNKLVTEVKLTTVTEISAYAFYDYDSLTSITIPSGVTSIGENAFYGCASLTTITFEENSKLDSIERYAFYNCTSLKSITIPSSVASIGDSSFYNCTSLTSVTIPDSVTSIGTNAFSSCYALKEVRITDIDAWVMIDFSYGSSNPLSNNGADLYLNNELVTEVKLTTATEISAYVFYGCDSLTSIIIPSSVTSIGDWAFYGCDLLTGITIPDSVTSIGEYAFSNCTSLTSIIIPSSVTSIRDSTFSNCTSLASITIPDSVTSIGRNAFYGCTSLTSITIPKSVTSIGSWAFEDCYALTEVYNYSTSFTVSNNSYYGYLGYYAKTIYNSGDLSDLEGSKPETKIQAIGNVQYYVNEDTNDFIALAPSINRDLITKVEFDSRTTEINQYAFSNCTSLTSIEIPSSVTSIGAYAFSNCASLTMITFEENSKLENIGERAFQNCDSLTSITIPEGVTNIGEYAFAWCYALVEIYNYSTNIPKVEIYNTSPNTNGYLGEYAKVVYNPNALQSGKPETKIQTIGNMQYYVDGVNFIALAPSVGRSNLIQVQLDSRTTEIYEYAFRNCTSLKSLTIPSSVTSIGEYAFYGCASLTTVTFEENSKLDSIERYAFYNCTSLKSITIPSSVTSIKDSSFYNCTSLTSVTIPDSVTSIGNSAFYNCTSLEEVHITDINAWLMIDFSNSSSNPLSNGADLYLNDKLVTEITFPEVTTIGDYVFFGCSSLTSITIPSSVTSIGESAFSGCTSLTSITIPDSVTSIGGSAFWCPNITTVYINGQAVASMLNDIYSYSAGGLLYYISTGEKVYIKTGLSVPSYITQNFRKQSTTETVNNIEYDVYIKN